MAKFKTVAKFTHPVEADLAKSFLENKGIECFLRDRHLVDVNNLISNALGGVRLDVAEADFDRATALLREVNENKHAVVEEDLVGRTCPGCGGTRTELLPGHRKGWALLVAFLTALPLVFLVVERWRCLDCGKEWSHKYRRDLFSYIIPTAIIVGIYFIVKYILESFMGS